jgi:hypothetical protein
MCTRKQVVAPLLPTSWKERKLSTTNLPTNRLPDPVRVIPERALLRMGAISIVVGVLLGLGVGAFHGGSQPWDLEATLPLYAANRWWGLVHLSQFVADVLLLFGFFALYRSLATTAEGLSTAMARLGMILAVVAEAIYGVNQAVDGIANKFVAEQWVSAPLAEKAEAFRIADAVRHIEIGTSSIWVLTGGISLLLFGLAIALGRTYPSLFGWAGIVLGLAQIPHSVNVAQHGFELAGFLGAAGIAVSYIEGLWTLALAVFLWRRARGSGRPAGLGTAAEIASR